jgi:hypothetical protein
MRATVSHDMLVAFRIMSDAATTYVANRGSCRFSAYSGHRDHPDRPIVIAEIGAS